MKKMCIIFLVVLCNQVFAHEIVRLVNIQLSHHRDVYELNEFDITIIDAGNDFAKALLSDREINTLEAAGYRVDILIDDYKAYKDMVFQRGEYHTYNEVYTILDSLVTDYPNICRLDTIGFSVLGRPIWAMRVTDNPQVEENEPEIRLAGNMHGDEHIGTEITLYFLGYLLGNYASNPSVQNLIDNRELWILPTLNPDGKVANERYNANNVDLNRDYGYFWDGWGNSPGPCSQIENKAMKQHLEENNISLEYNYHSAAEYVNYPWDYHQSDPPDSQHIISLSYVYSDSANLPIINGWDWYQVNGSLQDYTIGTSGALAWTIETDEPFSSSAIDQICYTNRDALMDVCNRAGWGIKGVVKDSLTDTPLYARIEVVSPERIDVYTDSDLGDFHKMIAQGTYNLKVSVNGYAPKTITNVNVPSTGSVALSDILLAPDTLYLYAFRVVITRYANHSEQNNKTQPRWALGAEDDRFFSLGRNGYVVLDMGPEIPLVDIPGDDFTVFEGDDGTAEGYTAYVSESWDGPWSSCGSASGTASFDISTTGLSEARYVRIVDDGSSTSGQYAGFDVDAIQFFTPIGIEETSSADVQSQMLLLVLSPNPCRRNINITVSAPGESKLTIYNAVGHSVKTFFINHGVASTTLLWDAKNNAGYTVPAGVYFIHLTSGTTTEVKKAILLK
jgi:murein tripeptide amidase MpaA